MTQPDSAQEIWTYNEADELAEWQPRKKKDRSIVVLRFGRGKSAPQHPSR